MSLRMAQGMVVPDMLEDLFDTVPRTIDGLGQCNFVFTCKPDGIVPYETLPSNPDENCADDRRA